METIAAYSDGSGDYRIERDGDSLVTTISNGGIVAERITQTLERAPHLDPHAHYYDYARSAWQCMECDSAAESCTAMSSHEWADWRLSERFYSSPDLGEDGAVLIDGLAYTVTH